MAHITRFTYSEIQWRYTDITSRNSTVMTWARDALEDHIDSITFVASAAFVSCVRDAERLGQLNRKKAGFAALMCQQQGNNKDKKKGKRSSSTTVGG